MKVLLFAVFVFIPHAKQAYTASHIPINISLFICSEIEIFILQSFLPQQTLNNAFQAY